MKLLLQKPEYIKILSILREGICHGHMWVRLTCLRIFSIYNSWYDDVKEYDNEINSNSHLFYERDDELYLMTVNLHNAVYINIY